MKPYPQPHPNIKNSKTRFSTGFKEVADKDGNKTQVETIGAAVFEYPLKKFRFNADEGASFVPELDAQGKPRTSTDNIFPYIPSKDIIELIRLAQILQRPILLKGEPGCGKTQLAKALAYEWYGEQYRDKYFEWHVKSSSRATDGLYTFDHVARLRDVQMSKNEPGAAEDLTKYRHFGPLAKAFLLSTEDAPSVVLIDEIDKADIDFPNDLLLELDERRFTVPETGESVKAKFPPLVFITSNDERELPEAFLRRCLFMYLKFPAEAQLTEIIRAHLPGFVEEYQDFIAEAIARFSTLRSDIEKDPADNKRVSTSELLDWLKAYRQDLKDKAITKDALTKESLTQLPMYYQALLKTFQGYKRENKG